MKARGFGENDAKRWSKMEGSVMGSKRLTPTTVGEIASKYLLLLLFYKIYDLTISKNLVKIIRYQNELF